MDLVGKTAECIFEADGCLGLAWNGPVELLAVSFWRHLGAVRVRLCPGEQLLATIPHRVRVIPYSEPLSPAAPVTCGAGDRSSSTAQGITSERGGLAPFTSRSSAFRVALGAPVHLNSKIFGSCSLVHTSASRSLCGSASALVEERMPGRAAHSAVMLSVRPSRCAHAHQPT